MHIKDLVQRFVLSLRSLTSSVKTRFSAIGVGSMQEPLGDRPARSAAVTRYGEHVPTDEFEGPKLKIERAKRHIADYRAAFKALSDANIVSVTPEVEAETGNAVLRVVLKQSLPSDLRLTAADAIYNLRSALDQAVCSCVRLAGGSPKGTYFPHGSDEAASKASLSEKCKKVPEPIRAAIAALEPYHGGKSYLLRVLHDLNIVDKHRDLLGVGPVLRKLSIASGGDAIPKGPVWIQRDGKFHFVEGHIGPVDQHSKLTFAVTFTDVEDRR